MLCSIFMEVLILVDLENNLNRQMQSSYHGTLTLEKRILFSILFFKSVVWMNTVKTFIKRKIYTWLGIHLQMHPENTSIVSFPSMPTS